MDDAKQIREKFEKIKALFEGAATDGEQLAAQAAMDRLRQRLDDQFDKLHPDPVQEFQFSIHNPWSMRLFIALCRSKGLEPYRYRRMRRTSICVRIGKCQLDTNLWPEFEQMDKVLTNHLSELAESIISDCINPDRSDANVVKALEAS